MVAENPGSAPEENSDKQTANADKKITQLKYIGKTNHNIFHKA